MALEGLKEGVQTVEKYSGIGAVGSFVADNLFSTLSLGGLTSTLAMVRLLLFSGRKLVRGQKSS